MDRYVAVHQRPNMFIQPRLVEVYSFVDRPTQKQV